MSSMMENAHRRFTEYQRIIDNLHKRIAMMEVQQAEQVHIINSTHQDKLAAMRGEIADLYDKLAQKREENHALKVSNKALREANDALLDEAARLRMYRDLR